MKTLHSLDDILKCNTEGAGPEPRATSEITRTVEDQRNCSSDPQINFLARPP